MAASLQVASNVVVPAPKQWVQTACQPLDGSGNLILDSRQETYTYDDLNRLLTVNYGDGETQSYGFDPMGNRLTKSDTAGTTTTGTAYKYDAANRLTSTANNGGSASAVTSDADGNTLSGSAR